MIKNILWLRHEDRLTERRTPLLPAGAATLVDNGYDIVVERSAKRIIPDYAYEAAGCRMVARGSWTAAPEAAVILGLKELPAGPPRLKNSHVYFAHAYKNQHGWQSLLRRFTRGGGNLLDIEYMVDKAGSRVVSFGFRAGYIGAALALIHWHNQQSGSVRYLDQGVRPFDNADLLHETIRRNRFPGKNPKVLIIGAGGRSGHGALDLLQHHGAEITCWGRDDTRHIDRTALLDHDILINCAFVTGNIPAFLQRRDLTARTRLSVIADVSCDPFSSFNPIPLYHDVTSWDQPYVTVNGSLDIIAIDNLPSLLPRESSQEFADQLLPHLLTLNRRDHDPVWTATRESFDSAVARMDNNPEQSGEVYAAE
ncbi:MAG: saccharopine dehydrogenase [Alphaproteobacteria bacterium]|nr:saccharopine dehydrogenase [Alphaproteobacteria bacterium]